MVYKYKHPRAALTVDCMIFGGCMADIKLLLVRRKNDPFKDSWALPGGFLEQNERLIDAARRELLEETGIGARDLHRFGYFDEPGRDPRGRTISFVFYGFVRDHGIRPRAGSDAGDAEWFSLDNLPPLAFDHSDIIAKAGKELVFLR